MYQSKYDAEMRDETNYGKRLVLWAVALLFAIGGVSWFFTRSIAVADTAVLRYEEFQEIYNTCQKINTDLGVIRAVDEKDRMFEAFSKSAVIVQKQQQLTRWVEDYNAKSRMWNRSMWKSSSLPYELTVSQFANFQGSK